MNNHTQRWRDRRSHFIPSTTVINPGHYAVDVISSEKIAAPFLAQHHYIGTLPAARLSIGLFRNGTCGTSDLVGVATFSQPVNNASVRNRTGLTTHTAACDLGRLVLLDDVPGNGETWFLARAYRLLRTVKPEIQSIIAYSDPVASPGVDGRPMTPGHIGLAYQSANAVYTGRTKARRRLVMPNGQVLSDRACAKIVSGDTGASYAIDQLVASGCSKPNLHEDPTLWLLRLKKENVIQSRYHPGCHAYTFPLTRTARLAMRSVQQLDRPRRDYSATSGDITALPLLAA